MTAGDNQVAGTSRPKPVTKQKDVMRIADHFVDKKTNEGTFGKNEDKLLRQMQDIEIELRGVDLLWTLSKPEERTAELWRECYQDWSGVDVDTMPKEEIVPVKKIDNLQVKNLMWCLFSKIMPTYILSGISAKAGVDGVLEAHIIWSSVKSMAAKQRVMQMQTANTKLQLMEPVPEYAKTSQYDDKRDVLVKLFEQRKLAGVQVSEEEMIYKFQTLLGPMPMIWSDQALAKEGAKCFSDFYTSFRNRVTRSDAANEVLKHTEHHRAGSVNQVQESEDDDVTRKKKWLERNKECLEKGLCFLCLAPGHLKVNCPKKNSDETEDPHFDAREPQDKGANGGSMRMVRP
jgi:hypothetical protein